jgi:hypothetical protein
MIDTDFVTKGEQCYARRSRRRTACMTTLWNFSALIHQRVQTLRLIQEEREHGS